MIKRIVFFNLIIISFILLIVWLTTQSPKSKVCAAKIRISRGSGSSSKSYVFTGVGRVVTSVRFRGDRKAIIINFSGLTNASSVNYSLSYESNGIPQGAMGTISNITTATDNRELLFGTCSGGVCRYHQNITNAKLVITSKLKSGHTTRKTYRLKV